MASVRAAYFWADGASVSIQAFPDAGPEAIAVARVNAVEGLREALDALEAMPDDFDVELSEFPDE